MYYKAGLLEQLTLLVRIRDAKRPQGEKQKLNHIEIHNDHKIIKGRFKTNTETKTDNIQITNYHKMITKRQCLRHKNKSKSKTLKNFLKNHNFF